MMIETDRLILRAINLKDAGTIYEYRRDAVINKYQGWIPKSIIDPENTASIKLVERLGFRKEGLFKQSIFINGKWVDDLVYAILQDEWIQR